MSVAIVKPTILIVEDDNLVRMETADNFADGGFEVLEAWSGSTALAMLETHADIRIVFTDIEMPGGMSGVALWRTVTARWPAIPVMMCSGPVGLALRCRAWQMPFFAKPYVYAEACAAAHDLLA